MLADVDEPLGAADPIPGLPIVDATVGSSATASAEPRASSADAPRSEPVEISIGTPPRGPDSPPSSGPPSSPEDDIWSSSVASGVAEPSRAPAAPAAVRQPSVSDEDGRPKSALEQAIPIDQLRQGTAAAASFFSWGFSQVREKAVEAHEEVSKSGGYARASTFVNQTASQANTVIEQASAGIEQVGCQAKANLDQLGTQANDGISKISNDLQPALNDAVAAAEAMKPKLREAKETARSSLFGFAAGAAKTAIWFQSLGAHRDDSSDEEHSPAAARPQSGSTQQAASNSAPAQQSQMAAPQQETAQPAAPQFSGTPAAAGST